MLSSYQILVTRSATDSNAPAVSGVAVTGTPTVYSDSWKGDCKWGLTVVTTGTLTGTWTLWATDKINPSLTDDTDWVDMSSAADFVETNPAGAATKWRADSVLLRAGNFRLKYVNATGTGTIKATVTRNLTA